ncbi:MAG TPA: twin-arginine translocase TatA/TatE family subunit, partial [Nitrospinaceae bacterium]|nr:twin-arginine translocase TatA/TatE family subunit [Nitrospinaceae bacterium]
SGAEAKEDSAPAAKSEAAKKEEELIEEAALEIKENRIGTIRTRHDGLVQQNDVFTTSLGRTPGGRGRDRGVSRDTF